MPTLDEALPLILKATLRSVTGAVHPFDSVRPFASAVAALLDRQLRPSSWRPIVEALKDAGLLDPEPMDRAGMPEIQEAIRGKAPAISPRSLSPVKQLARWLVDRHQGRAEILAEPRLSIEVLREELASIRGIGPAGADAIILAVSGRPSYPVDRGTYRILVRHGWLDASSSYEEARDLMVHHAGDDSVRLGEAAAGMTWLASHFCRATAPRCEACPLASMLPPGGPVGAETD